MRLRLFDHYIIYPAILLLFASRLASASPDSRTPAPGDPLLLAPPLLIAQAASDPGRTTPQAQLDSPEHSPGVAVSLAILPGIAIHGAGHFYAGRPLQAAALLLVEAGAGYMAYRGASEVYAVSQNFDLAQNAGESGQLSYGVGLAAGGLFLFLTSWLYDVTGAPMAAAETAAPAQKATAHNAPTVTPQITRRGVELVLERLF
jgi:hypothetical protein